MYGNYHGYYTKRPFRTDIRLELLPDAFFRDKTVLDIGCNEGWVTCEIAHTRGACRVLGVDIDDALVRAAWRRRRTLWSLQSPRTHDVAAPSSKRIRLGPDNDEDVPDYFPASCEQTHGPLPIPSSDAPSHRRDAFPHNLAFKTADWLAQDPADDDETYDVVVAFSITKWIHLHRGDKGVTTFFRRVHRVLKPGGALLLEPQAWDTYHKARHMDPKLRENAKHLALRPHDFPAVLQDIGFRPPQHLGTSGQGGFHRPVDLYLKK